LRTETIFSLEAVKGLSNALFKGVHARKTLKAWKLKGKPVPPPQLFKQSVIKEYAKKFRTSTFVETGTYHGDTLFACRNEFNKLYSIELDEKLYQLARARFAKSNNISILCGDSGQVLESLLKDISKKTLFWLDGHYSEGATAKGNLNTPIINELTHISNHYIKDHVVLIDDARCFTGEDDYPSISFLKDFVNQVSPDMEFKVEDDIIRISR